MPKILSLFFVVYTSFLFGQASIPSSLMNKAESHEFYLVDGHKVESITVIENNYLKNSSYIHKWIYNYTNDSVVTGVLYRDNELKSRFTYLLDTDMKKTKEIKTIDYGPVNFIERRHLKIERNDSVTIQNHYGKDGKLTSKYIIRHDSLNSPTSIILLTNEQIDSRETAVYNYKTNSYRYQVYNQANEKVLDEVNYYNPDFILEKNELGHTTKLYWPLSKDKSIVTFEYRYDKKNNWVKRTKKVWQNNEAVTTTTVNRDIRYKKN